MQLGRIAGGHIQSQRLSLRQDPRLIQTAAVVDEPDDDSPGLRADPELEPALFRFAGAGSLVRIFDTVDHRVGEQMDQRLVDPVEDRLVEGDLTSRGDYPDPLLFRLSQLP